MTDTLAPEAAGTAPTPPPKRSLWHRLYHGETTFDFVGRRKIGFIISGTLILITLVSLFTRGLNLGLDFEGGVAWEAPATNELTVDRAESILEDHGVDPAEAKIQTLRGADGDRLRIQVGAQEVEVQAGVRTDLAEAAGTDVQEVSLNAVSPTWGDEITKKAVRALVVFLIAIAIYVTFRFEWKMAAGALVAVVHDVLISVGVYSVFGFEVTPQTVVAFLTILGFSLYDTVVVFDKVHENTKQLGTGRYTYGDIVNLSMNQVLMRSINTSIAAVLPVLSLLVVGSWMLGAIALEDFAIALLVGLLIGAYSSIYIATPILAVLKEREPRYKQLRTRVGASAPAPVASGEAVPVTAGATAASATATGPVVPATGLSHPPRPRKKKRR